MITLAERRRTGRFADLVDADRVGHAEADEIVPLLMLSQTLRRVPVNGDIDPEFRAKLRARVVAISAVRLPTQRETALAAATPAPSDGSRSRPGRRLILAGASMACVLSLAGVGAASMDAVAGDPLYSIKRATEYTQLKLARSDTDRGRRYLTLARTRLGEARQLRGDQRAAVHTLAAMDLATRKGTRLLTGVAASEQDRAPLDIIDEFVVAQRADLGSLISQVSAGPARERAVESLVLVERLRGRSIALRAMLVCPAAAAPADDLGPRPVDCATAGPSSVTPGPLNGLSGPASSGVGGTALPGASSQPGSGASAPAVPPVDSDATDAVAGIVEELVESLGGGVSSTPAIPSTTPPPLGLPLPVPVPSGIPILPPLPVPDPSIIPLPPPPVL